MLSTETVQHYEAEIRQFFEHYRQAFNQLDGAAVAQMYALPSGVAAGGRFLHWNDSAQVRAKMENQCAFYRQEGYRQALYQIVFLQVRSEQHAVADLKWEIQRQHGPSWFFHTGYHLLRSGGGWRVTRCTEYDGDL